jgi:hypothetical protein
VDPRLQGHSEASRVVFSITPRVGSGGSPAPNLDQSSAPVTRHVSVVASRLVPVAADDDPAILEAAHVPNLRSVSPLILSSGALPVPKIGESSNLKSGEPSPDLLIENDSQTQFLTAGEFRVLVSKFYN